MRRCAGSAGNSACRCLLLLRGVLHKGARGIDLQVLQQLCTQLRIRRSVSRDDNGHLRSANMKYLCTGLLTAALHGRHCLGCVGTSCSPLPIRRCRDGPSPWLVWCRPARAATSCNAALCLAVSDVGNTSCRRWDAACSSSSATVGFSPWTFRPASRCGSLRRARLLAATCGAAHTIAFWLPSAPILMCNDPRGGGNRLRSSSGRCQHTSRDAADPGLQRRAPFWPAISFLRRRLPCSYRCATNSSHTCIHEEGKGSSSLANPFDDRSRRQAHTRFVSVPLACCDACDRSARMSQAASGSECE